MTGTRAGVMQPRLEIVPCTIREASSFVDEHHRHHAPPQGGRFALAVADDSGNVRGVAIVGTPVARLAVDGWTAEVTRVATDGCPNACSALYGGAWRAARALGYRKLITYTLPGEGGSSLRGAGWSCLGESGGGDWSRRRRPRVDEHPRQVKMKWQKVACQPVDNSDPACG